MKVIILNDTSSSRHAGCMLTMEAYKELCKSHDMEIVGTVPWDEYNLKQFYKHFEKADLLIVNGEGSIHDCRRGELVSIAKDFPSVLINCVYQANPDKLALKQFKYIAARESNSAGEIRDAGAVCDVVPDLLFGSTVLHQCERLVLAWNKFNPDEYKLGITDSCLIRKSGDIRIYGNPISYIRSLLECRRVCTGRFHGIVICSMLGIPFTAYGTSTHKNHGIMHDMDMLHLYHKDRAGALSLEPASQNDLDELYAYRVEAQYKVLKMFKEIRELRG